MKKPGKHKHKPKPQFAKVFQDSFEEGISNIWAKEFSNDDYSGSISTKYARDGKSSLRIELRKDDPSVYGSKRSEIATVNTSDPLGEYNYSFSVLLPKGGDEDYTIDPKGSEIIAQWHNTPDQGEEWTYPPLALHTWGNGHYILYRCWDEDPMSTEQKMDKEGKRVSYDLGTYSADKGKWVDWKFHIKWGWRISHNPLIQIYKNGIKIFELKDQPNTTNDKVGNYMKLGIYKWDWSQPESNNNSILAKRIIYYDAVCIEKV